jgi:glycosyltransferase involved in cell wall biosynthesis
MKPVRVLHILGTAEVSGTGISNMVRVLVEQLDRTEFQVAACFLGPGGPWTDLLNTAGVPAFEVPWSTPRDVRGAYRFWKFLGSRPVDLLHVHYGGRSIRRLARIVTGAPLVMHVHGRVRNEGDYKPVRLRLTDVDAVIATSRAVADVVKAGRMRVVYPGVRLTVSAESRDTWTIGAAGRLVPIKGYDRLLEAFATLWARHPQARLEIAGDGPSRVDLERQARALHLGEAVTFLGWSDDLPTLMARWSVFAQPSMEEALGIGVLQAMAAGLPVVASDVGGLPEIVESGVTGVLVPPGNVPALTEALEALLLQPELRGRLGETARRHAGQFTESRFAADVAEAYREVLASRPGTVRSL